MRGDQNNVNFPNERIVSEVSAHIREIQLERRQVIREIAMRKQAEADEIRTREERKIEAAEETAANTAVTNERLQEVIDNQNDYIKILKKQLEVSESQLQALRNLFVSMEDGVSVEKELASIIKTEIDENHPLWNYVADKGGDIAVGGIITPILYNAIKEFFRLHGVLLP